MSDRPNSDQPKLSPILGLPVDDEPSRPAPSAATETTLTPMGEEIRFELSVIIPARNEERNLPACLESLLVQDSSLFPLGTDWELIVVDDHSTDRTRAIAQEAAARHEGVRVLEAPSLADTQGGFTGKTNACWFGAQHARGRWLLFTDADTMHEPNDLRHALHEAEKYKAVLLSYSPRQIVSGVAQRAVMPLIFSELASVYPPAEVNDPDKRTAAANGQFLLVERGAYFAVGGHRAVGGSVLEDVDLAWNMKRAKRTIRFRYAPDALSTRMYRGFGDMVEGWTKNLALLFPHALRLAAWRTLDVSAAAAAAVDLAAAVSRAVAASGDCAAVAAHGHPLLYSGGAIALRVRQLCAVRLRAAAVHCVAGAELDAASRISPCGVEGKGNITPIDSCSSNKNGPCASKVV